MHIRISSFKGVKLYYASYISNIYAKSIKKCVLLLKHYDFFLGKSNSNLCVNGSKFVITTADQLFVINTLLYIHPGLR